MTPNQAFGRALRERRKSQNQTQADLAFAAGLDRTYISLLELGQRSPTLETIIALCTPLDLRFSILAARIEHLLEAGADA